MTAAAGHGGRFHTARTPSPCPCLQHSGLPGGVLSHVEGTVHYLDLAGLAARSLRDFGATMLPPPNRHVSVRVCKDEIGTAQHTRSANLGLV